MTFSKMKQDMVYVVKSLIGDASAHLVRYLVVVII